jgi:4-hydroxy-tetrahydrodipicolinate reductase
MKIAIIGYGKMGREIESVAIEKGHSVVLKADIDNLHQMDPDKLRKADVAIEFTSPDSARENIIACFNAGIPVVSGTTGWTGQLDEIKRLCINNKNTFFYASNFSIGVNILFRINRWLAGVMDKFPEYEVTISEIHHIHKKDSPSGTAITLAEDIVKNLQRKAGWKNEWTEDNKLLAVISERTGEVPGTHTVAYRSNSDILELSHQALNRTVFATGAILAAEFIVGKTGVYSMDDLLEF